MVGAESKAGVAQRGMKVWVTSAEPSFSQEHRIPTCIEFVDD